MSSVKHFIKHSMIYAIGNIANRIGAFILLPLYTNYLTTAQYGVLEIFYSINIIIASLLGLGLAHASLRFYFEYNELKDRNRVISTSIITSLLLSIIGVSGVLLFRENLSLKLFDTVEYSNVFYIACAIVVFEISTQIILAYFRAKEYSTKYIILSFLTMVLQVGCNIITVGKLHMGVKGILIGNFIAIFSTWLIMCWITLKECGIAIDARKLKELILYSYPMLMGIILSSVLTNADRFILKSFDSLSSVGVYALALKLASVVDAIFLDPFKKNFGAYRFSIMKQEDAPLIYSKITTYMFFTIIYLSLGLSMFSKDILRLLSRPDYWEAAEILPVVCIGLIIGSLGYPFQTGIFISKKTKYSFYITTCSGILTLLLNFLLVPSFGPYGCAAAKCLAVLGGVILTYNISQKMFYVKYDFPIWLKALILAIIFYMISLGFFNEPIILSMATKFILIISYPICLYYLKCFKEEEKTAINYYIRVIVNFVIQRINKIRRYVQ